MHLSAWYMFLETCCIDFVAQFPVTRTNRIGLMLGISVAVLDSFCLEYFDSVWMEVKLNVWNHCFLRIFHVKHQMLTLTGMSVVFLTLLMKWRILHSAMNITFRRKYFLCVTDCWLVGFFFFSWRLLVFQNWSFELWAV